MYRLTQVRSMHGSGDNDCCRIRTVRALNYVMAFRSATLSQLTLKQLGTAYQYEEEKKQKLLPLAVN